MAKWQDSLITNDGLDMLVQLLNGGTLTITRAALGGGTVDTAALIRQTSLTAPIPVEAKIAQKNVISGAGVDVKIRVTNSGVTTTRTMRQVGVFAKLESGEEKLFAIMQDTVGDEIPTAAEYPEFLLEFTSAIAVSNTDNIVVQISNNVFVTYEDLEDALKGYSKTSHTHAAATQSAAGMMSAADKKKLDGIAAGANKITVDSALSDSSANPVQNKVVNAALAGKSNTDHTHAAATQSAAGMMSAADKKKLDGIAAGANKITVDSALSDSSANPVQNKVVNAALAEKANKADLPTELPAKGGNADTVDGKHADEFYPAKATNVEGGDYDTLVNDGIYEIQGNAATPSANAPDGNNSSNNFYVQVFVHSANWLTQIATSARGDRKQYIRSKENGVWNAWQRISAGDAETLGGKSAADFMLTAGGTISGPLYLKDSRYVHGVITDGTHGGFYDCAEITVKTAWANHSVVFTMSNRGSRPITVVLIFTNVATADPEIASLMYYGGSIYNNRVVCYKAGTSTWRLAVHMLDKNDKWTVHDYYRGESKNMISITWMSDYLSAAIPDGATVATLGGYIQNAERLNTARAIDGVSFDGTADISHYAICSTAAATAAKTVALAGFVLKAGARVAVKFTVTNTAASPTLNANNTGAKAIYYRGAAISAGYLAANRTYEFVYNGTQYELVGDLDTNTDTKVTQNNSTANAAYRVLLSPNANDTAETNGAVKSANFIANPSTGAFCAKGYDRIDITGQTLDLNDLNLSAGHPRSMFYICVTAGGSSAISNRPLTEGNPFILDVELVRWCGSTDYIAIQTYVTVSDLNVQYFRTCTNGTWSAWSTRVFTDTVYTLPNAGTGNYGGVKIGSNITVSNGIIGISRSNVNDAVGNAGATEIGLHKTCVGTAAPDDTNCPVGAWYGQY